jgi:hypothetical protein
MKTEQIEQIVAATDNLIAQSISDAVAEQFKKQNKTKPSTNTNMIIGIVVGFILILALFAGNSKLNNVADTIKEDNAGTAAVVTGAVTGIQESIELGDADILAGLDGVQAGIGEIKDSVAKIPTKPVVITKAPTVSKEQKYNNCVKWVNGAGLDAANAKLYLDACRNVLK